MFRHARRNRGVSLSSARHPAGVDKSFSGCQPINKYFIIQSRQSESERAGFSFREFRAIYRSPVSLHFLGCKLRNITRAPLRTLRNVHRYRDYSSIFVDNAKLARKRGETDRATLVGATFDTFSPRHAYLKAMKEEI